MDAFLDKFYPSWMTAAMRNEISTFRQDVGEDFGDCLERFKSTISECPHHGFSEETLLSTFYRGVLPTVKKFLDGASNGNFLSRDVDSGWELLDNMSISFTPINTEYGKPQKEQTPGSRKDIKSIHEKLDKIWSKKSRADKQMPQEEGVVESSEEECSDTEDVSYVQATNQGFQSNWKPYQNQSGYNNYKSNNYNNSYRNNNASNIQEPSSPGKTYNQQPAQNFNKTTPPGFQPKSTPAPATVTPADPTDVSAMLQQLLLGQASLTDNLHQQITSSHTELRSEIAQLHTHVHILSARLTTVENQIASTPKPVPLGNQSGKSILGQLTHPVKSITLRSGKELPTPKLATIPEKFPCH